MINSTRVTNYFTSIDCKAIAFFHRRTRHLTPHFIV